MIDQDLALRYIDDEVEVARCFPLMLQLRPHLASGSEFLARWRRQTAAGYRLVALFDGPRPLALAGVRVQENLVHGRFLYIDDLVTDTALRSAGHGARLLGYLYEQARTLDCSKLVLDTSLANSLGHRFYFRCGLLATSLRFNMAVEA